MDLLTQKLQEVKIELNKCSVKNCTSSLSEDRALLQITEIEKEYGLMCSSCIRLYLNNKGNLLICKKCGTLVDIFAFNPQDPPFINCNDTYYCESCSSCNGDTSDERTISKKKSPNLFFKTLNQIKQWLKTKS